MPKKRKKKKRKPYANVLMGMENHAFRQTTTLDHINQSPGKKSGNKVY